MGFAESRWMLGVLGAEKSEERKRKFWGAKGRGDVGDGLSFWNFGYFAAGDGKPGLRPAQESHGRKGNFILEKRMKTPGGNLL